MIRDVEIVIAQLEELTQQGFIFRGHESFRYTLTPNAFRDDTLIRMNNEFGIQDSVINEWLKHKFIMQHINQWYLLGKRELIPSERQVVNKLLHYCLYLMRYNHSLNLFVQKNPRKVSQTDRDTILERTLEYWKSEDTFHHLFSSYFPRLIRLYHLNNTLMQDANPFENLASVDETLPQHYGTPTAALDWTFNYNIAIYFAVGEKEVAEKFLKIYALKIHNSDLSPIHIMDKSILIENLRAERQEGTFSYFTKPCSFYMQHGSFPSINYFDQHYKNNLEQSTFELKEFIIERNKDNINYFKNLLTKKEITKEFLFPNEETEFLVAI